VSILAEIVQVKRGEVARAKQRISPDALSARAKSVDAPTRGFRSALARKESPSVIAELKRRSPSKGEIRRNFDAVACAREYAAGGAAALSVLTDETFFGGHLDYLMQVRRAVPLPLLRKDFTVDAYQIDEARVAGADAILLIVSILSAEQLSDFSGRARDLGLDVLVEVHDEAELQAALAVGADLVGVNNRDLRTFEVDLETTARLARQIPSEAGALLVAESGIGGPADLEYLREAGAGAFLVGESLMREPNIADALRALLSEPISRRQGRVS